MLSHTSNNHDAALILQLCKDDYINAVQSKIDRDHEEELLTHNLLVEEHHNRESELIHKEYDCDICYNSVETSELYIFDCDHRFCIECAYEHISNQIFNGVTEILCPYSGCDHVISFEEVYQIIKNHEPVDVKLLEKYERFLVNDYLKKEPNCRYCPRCGTAVLGDPNVPQIHCPNENCMKDDYQFCFNCKETWHSGLTCAQYQEWKRMNCEADKRFLSWAQKNTRKCPKCSATIEKNRGCNHMTCVNCGYQFCWLCMQHYTPSHFKNGKCKQYS
ncbi:RBR-type E3 ubiquitin transferase [Entamoeba marina]